MSKENFNFIIEQIKNASSFILTTHRKSDGDGIGSQIAMFHALNKINKKARVINVDAVPEKYGFITNKIKVENWENPNTPRLDQTDIALIFDTNDYRLIDPLYSEIKSQCKQIFFIDHHPALTNGPLPTPGSWIDIDCASTGEMAFKLISELKVSLDPNIAEAIYTSIVFDTQLFRYTRRSGTSHEIAAKLLKENFDSLGIHRTLFGNYTATKLKFIAKAVSQVEFYAEDKVAVALISKSDLDDFKLLAEDTRDIIDMIMNIETLEVAVLIREDGPLDYKVSLRSRGKYKVNQIAEALGGGGHAYAAGATILHDLLKTKKDTLDPIIQMVRS